MKLNLRKFLALAGVIAALGLSTGNVAAQRGGGGGGNFDPAQFRQMRIDRFREQLEVTNDDEWKVLEGAIGKVVDAQMDAMAGMARGMMGGGRRNRGGDQGAGGPPGGGNRPNPFGGTPDPDSEALQAAIDNKAPAEDLKGKLAKVRANAKAKEAKLTATQDDLKKLLTARQEAIAVTVGLLK